MSHSACWWFCFQLCCKFYTPSKPWFKRRILKNKPHQRFSPPRAPASTNQPPQCAPPEIVMSLPRSLLRFEISLPALRCMGKVMLERHLPKRRYALQQHRSRLDAFERFKNKLVMEDIQDITLNLNCTFLFIYSVKKAAKQSVCCIILIKNDSSPGWFKYITIN